ncbi:MAG: phosphatidylserine decarboxylase family protein [Bacteroidales bacterium]|nr:phosphatidylserine decarboxylase family protein [Bacteroidales bacterium]
MIHKEGRISVLITFFFFAAVITALLLFTGLRPLPIIFSILVVVLFIFIAYFFRDPKRKTISSAANEVLSSADGKVVIVKEVEEDEYLHSKALQVSVFMSLFNVHVNYYPVGGLIIYKNYHPGDYLVAWHPKSSVKNERTSVVVETESGAKILFRQIAGYIARRIVCYAKEGEKVAAGEQLGFIKFGSRVDFFLPLDSEVLVKVGDKVSACRTVIARLK